MERDLSKLSSLERGLLFYDSLLPDRWQSSEDLGRQLGVKSRAVKSYAAMLMSYGWPVLGNRGRGKGYKLDEPGTYGIRFTTRDLFSLAILLAQSSSTLPTREARKLRSKLKALLPNLSRRQVSELEEMIAVQGFAPKDWELVEHIGTCLSDRKYSLLLDYQGRHDSSPARRRALPVRIRRQDAAWYLDVYDLDKCLNRSFRFDRVKRSSVHRQSVPHCLPADTSFEEHKWDFGAGPPIDVALEISDSLAKWLLENPEHPSQQLEKFEATFVASYRVRRLELFADWTLSLRGARVKFPDELRCLIKQRAKAWLSEQGTLNFDWEP